jgi:hypothetical protein
LEIQALVVMAGRLAPDKQVIDADRLRVLSCRIYRRPAKQAAPAITGKSYRM